MNLKRKTIKRSNFTKIKKTHIIILSIVLTLGLLSCNTREVREVNNPITGKPLEKYEVKETDDGSFLKDGFYKKWHMNGQIEVDCNYELNKREGPYKTYYENGQINVDATFKQDSTDGHYIKYYKTGIKMWEGNYALGKTIGKWGAWHENQQQMSLQEFNEKGRLDGQQKYWFSNGQVSLVGEAKNGEKIGTWSDYVENGEPRRIYKYNGGVDIALVGKWQIDNGNVIDYLADYTFLMIEPKGKQYRGTYEIVKDILGFTASTGLGGGSFKINKLLENEYKITSTKLSFLGKDEIFTAKRIQ